MLSQLLILALPFFTLSAAQAYGQKSSSATTKATAKTTHDAAATTAASASSAIHTVQVGSGGLVFTPNSLKAAVGDQVEFHFASSGHSVAEGSFKSACEPSGESAFYSGFVKPGGEPFTITVNSTDPLWFYCTQVGHCQAGMVGVINPTSGETEAEYAAAAAKTKSSKSPSHVQGGVFAAAKAGGSSGGGSTTTTTTSAASSSAASATPTPGGAAHLTVMSVLGLVGLSAPVAFVAMAGF